MKNISILRIISKIMFLFCWTYIVVTFHNIYVTTIHNKQKVTAIDYTFISELNPQDTLRFSWLNDSTSVRKQQDHIIKLKLYTSPEVVLNVLATLFKERENLDFYKQIRPFQLSLSPDKRYWYVVGQIHDGNYQTADRVYGGWIEVIMDRYTGQIMFFRNSK